MDNAYDKKESGDVNVYSRKTQAAPGITRAVKSKTIVPAGSPQDEALGNEREAEYQANAQRVTQMLKGQG